MDEYIDHGDPSLSEKPKPSIWFGLFCAAFLWLVLLAAIAVARADPVGTPFPLIGFNEIQGSITGAAQNVAFTFGQGQKTWCILNPGNQNEVIFFRLTATADTTAGHNGEIAAGQYVCWGGSAIANSGRFTISVNAVTNPHPYFAFEGE